MRIAIVGDAHLTLRKYKEFEENRFKLLINELIAAKPHIILFAGDLLDHARPTLEELQLLYFAIAKIEAEGIKVVIIDGNHEALTENTSTYDLIMNHSKHYIKGSYLYNVKCKNPNTGIRAIGWTNVKQVEHKKSSNILVSHLRANHGLLKEEYDIKHLSESYELVFLGDLHFRYSPYKNVHYTSSPYSTKFTESKLNDYGYVMLESNDSTWQYVDLNLPCKVKRSCWAKDISKTLEGLDNHLVKLEVKGTLEELQNLPVLGNVIYVKSIQEEVQTVITQVKGTKSDPLKDIEKYIVQSEFIKKYPDSTVKIKDKIQELKG